MISKVNGTEAEGLDGGRGRTGDRSLTMSGQGTERKQLYMSSRFYVVLKCLSVIHE